MNQEFPNANVADCDLCGHNFDDHLVKGYGELPLEGWMECPVSGCNCSMTWSVCKTKREEFEKYKDDKGLS